MITDYIRRRDKARMMEDEQQAVRPVRPMVPMSSPSIPLDVHDGQDFQIAQGHTPPESPDVMPDMRPPTLEDQRARAWDEYQRAVVTPPRKEKAWKEAVYLGLQGLRDVFSDRPSNEPYRLLRDVNKDKEVARLSANVAALEGRSKAEQERAYNDARIAELKDRPQRAKDALKAKVEAAKVAFERRIDFLNKSQDVKSGKAAIYTDENGKVWRRFLTPDSEGNLRPDEPVPDPENPGQQDIDPNFRLYTVESSESGTPVQIKGRDLFSGEAAITSGNVRIANQDIKDENQRNEELGKVESQITGNKTRMDALSRSNATLRNEINNLNPTTVYGDKERAAALQQQIKEQEKEFFDLQGKTKELETQRKTLKQPLQKRQTIKSAVPKSKDPLGIFQ